MKWLFKCTIVLTIERYSNSTFHNTMKNYILVFKLLYFLCQHFFVKEWSGTNWNFFTLKNWGKFRLKTKISQHSFKNKLTKSLGKKASSTKVLFNLITSSWLLNEPNFNAKESLQKEPVTTQQQFPRSPNFMTLPEMYQLQGKLLNL